MRAVYAHGDQWRPTTGRSPRRRAATPTRSSPSTATTAARSSSTRCGRRSARARSSGWSASACSRYRDESAGTGDFIELASKVARRDLTGFLEAWLYGKVTPPMPNHPDWTVLPVVEAPAPAAAALSIAGDSTRGAARRR